MPEGQANRRRTRAPGARRTQGKGSREPDAGVEGLLGVIDLGSNTVRLVVYDLPERLPVPMFNEKAECRLVAGMSETGRLNPEGIERTREALARFVGLASHMRLEDVDIIATAAVREAEDGAEFVADLEREFGYAVQVISGAEEAQLAALGVLSGVPDADGILADMGGGTVDLVALDKGSFGANATFPLGHLRLSELAGGKLEKAQDLIQANLATAPWLADGKGRTFYAVGGAWRTIARIFIEQEEYPLHIIDNFELRLDDAQRLIRLISRLSPSTIAKIPGVTRRRSETLPVAALVLGALLDRTQPARVMFSGFGMREGQMIRRLPPKMRDRDPLIAGCESLAQKTRRFSLDGNEVMAWLDPLFGKKEPKVRARRRHAACLLSDLGWNEHPDYRGIIAFLRTLRLPFAGLTHPDRAAIALTVLLRYKGNADDPAVAPVMRLLDEEEITHCRAVGAALRLAHTISGSAPGLLQLTRLKRTKTKLTLHLGGESEVLLSETVERRLGQLADILGLQAEIA